MRWFVVININNHTFTMVSDCRFDSRRPKISASESVIIGLYGICIATAIVAGIDEAVSFIADVTESSSCSRGCY